MEALAALHCDQTLTFSLCQSFPSLRRPFSSILVSPSSSSFIRSPYSSSSPPSTSDPFRQIYQKSEPLPSQSLNPFLRLASMAAITGASALLLLRFCQNNLVRNPIVLPPIVSMGESIGNESLVTEFLGDKIHLVHSISYCKLKEKAQIVDEIIEADALAWKVLETQVCSCKEELERLRIGFEAILEKDPSCNKSYHDDVLEKLEKVDECKGLLKKIRVDMYECERDNLDMKYYIQLFNTRIAIVKVLEGEMIVALKRFQELEKVEQQMVRTFYACLTALSGDSSLIKILSVLQKVHAC